MKNFDAIIIGSGQAGTPLAFTMASKGKKIAFVEKNTFGGTCLNVGCTPTKMYVASARRMWEALHGEELGIYIPKGPRADLKRIKARKDAHIQKSVTQISRGIENNENITFFKGEAVFTGHKEVAVGDDLFTAETIFINVGGRPYIPEGYEEVPYLTNESILELEELPEHLIIVGGSYIGLEFGQMFRRFGSRVTIIEKNNRIIHREDEETSQTIQRFMEDEGVVFRLGAKCLSGKMNDDHSISVQVACSEEGPLEIQGSHLLLAVGRSPNTDSLNLQKTGVETDGRGFIPVNDYLQTNVPGVFALGDCNGKGAFTHTAYNDYEIVAENTFKGADRKVSDRIVTYGLFVDPPLGRVGMTLREARAEGFEVLLAHRPFSRIARAREKGETNGYMSVIVDAATKKIIGATVLGVGGDEIISSLVNIMYAGATYDVIRDSVQPHPTVSELIPTMLESVRKV